VGTDGITRVVEVGEKAETAREAVAECWITMAPRALESLKAGTVKGQPLESAKLAGLLGVKQTPALLPHCHPVRVTGAEILLELQEPGAAEEPGRIRVQATVRALDRTGAEMEALTAAATAALSLYDTAKASDRGARIDGLRLLAKSGGRGGPYRADDAPDALA
jgi:cyclic pyranopterin phosphate synthase